MAERSRPATALASPASMLALRIGRGTALREVHDFAEASALYRAACDAHARDTGEGASTMSKGVVCRVAPGRRPAVVARISWNGKVWPNTPWTAVLQPLYTPPPAGVVATADAAS